MKVAIEHKALMQLMLACGEAQGVLLRAGQLVNDHSGWRNLSNAANQAREGLQAAVEELNTFSVGPASQEYTHSGPG